MPAMGSPSIREIGHQQTGMIYTRQWSEQKMQSDEDIVNQIKKVNPMRSRARAAAFVDDLRRLCLSCTTGGRNRATASPYPFCDYCRKKWAAANEIERLSREREALVNTLAMRPDCSLIQGAKPGDCFQLLEGGDLIPIDKPQTEGRVER